LFAAFLARRTTGDRVWGAVGKGVGIVVLTLVGIVIGSQFRTFFGVDKSINSGAITQVIKKAQHGSSGGTSDFGAKQVQSPADVPMAVVSVMFRPLPFDAHNATALLAAVEGTILLGMFVWSWRRYKPFVRWARKRPYLVLAAVYWAIFIYAFSSIGNFGLLTRQRPQVLPFALILLAVPLPRKQHR
jgi:hypothetical protein